MRATTTATISPANVTRSTAIGGWAGVTWSGVSGQTLGSEPCSSAMSLPVITVTTLGAALASSTLIAVMFAWANGLRTMAMCSMPFRVMLSVQFVRPVISRWSSLRRRSRPISRPSLLPGRPGLWSSQASAVPAAVCTALTMLW